MRYYMVDPDNEERLLKIPRHVVDSIKAKTEQRVLAEQLAGHMIAYEEGFVAALNDLEQDLLTDAPYYIKAEEVRTAINALKVGHL